MNNKSELRIIAKSIRKNLPLDIISKKAVEQIRKCDLYKKAQNVMLYYPTKYEINLLELFNDNKNFYLPRVNGEHLDICPYKNGDKLKKSDFKILEPINNSVKCEILDLVIVPALMADSQGYRLGYGGGYYDRFLSAYPDIYSVGLAYECQVVNEVRADTWDRRLDMVITQESMYVTGTGR